MRTIATSYLETLQSLINRIAATDASGTVLETAQALEQAARTVQCLGSGKMMFVGNGASAAISSHMASDYTKNGGVRAMAFNDPALLTCMGNDFGYAHVFEKPVEYFTDAADLLVAISSSGRSENILRAADMAKAKSAKVITLSGFKADNPLRAKGDLNFYVPIEAYGPVEILHHAICHCILDTIIEFRASGKAC